MKPIWHLDEPSLLRDPADKAVFQVKGWIASDEMVKNIGVAEKIDGREAVELRFIDRPDLKKALGFKGLRHIGFEGERPFGELEPFNHITITFEWRGEKFEIIAPVNNDSGAHLSDKQNKLKRLLPYLICPECKQDNLQHQANSLLCETCSVSYSYSENNINFLTDELSKKFEISSTENISSNAYDKTVINIINRFHRGLILDCGAGSRQNYYRNVVNYEVVPYPSTDILGVGERLPFKDNTFDAVFSLAVLEHVNSPFECSDEILRVLKKGGILYCQIPFLQPFHGYPHHYYNMTQKGMTNLFKNRLDINELDVLDFGQPIHALRWFLELYVKGLPNKERKRFLIMKLKDLLKPLNELMLAPFVVELFEETKRDLACCNYLIGRKTK